MESTVEKLKVTAREEATAAVHIGKQAAGSGTYMFPIQGIYHFLRHPALQRPLWIHILPTIALSFVIITAMFFTVYLPQAAVLTFVDGPIAFLNAAMLTLSESSTVILAISRWWWIEDATLEVFDAVLVEQGQTNLVAQGRELKSSNSSDPLSKLGRRIKKPFGESLTKSIARYFILLPLNFIPVFGTAIFLILNARNIGPSNHARYFQLKGFSETERADFIKKKQGDYVGFGLACVLLNLLPIANIAFAFTNTVGAALWAAKLEKEGTQTTKKAQ